MTGEPAAVQAVNRYLATNVELRRALEIPDGAVVDTRLLARGEYNTNYVFAHPVTGQQLVFRINLGSQMHLADQIGYEARALRLLEPSGRTPKVLYVDASKSFEGQGVLVETWLPGRPLSYETDLPVAACILADVHSVPVPENHGLLVPENPLHAIIHECVAMFARYTEWVDARPALVVRMMRWFQLAEAVAENGGPGGHIVNTEVNSGNFLIVDAAAPDAGCLVDWEKPLVSSVEQDLAHFLVPTTTYWKTDSILNRGEIDEFVSHYRAAVDGRFPTEGIEERLDAFMRVTCLRGVTWCAMAFAQHVTGQRSVADDFTLAKITEYLDDDFLDRVEQLYYS